MPTPHDKLVRRAFGDLQHARGLLRSLAHLTHREAHSLMRRLKEDVCALCERQSELAVVLLADGAPELWNLFSEHLNARTLGIEPRQLVDAWHALEYVAAAARLSEARGHCFPGTFRLQAPSSCFSKGRAAPAHKQSCGAGEPRRDPRMGTRGLAMFSSNYAYIEPHPRLAAAESSAGSGAC